MFTYFLPIGEYVKLINHMTLS